MEKLLEWALFAKETSLQRFAVQISMKKIAFAVWLFSATGLFSQQAADSRPFSFGFLAGAELQTLNIQRQPLQTGRPFIPNQNLTGAGASLGIWAQWPVFAALDVRQGLQFSLLSNTIRFETPDGQSRQDQYRFADLELPFHFILSNQLQRLPAKALILFGGRASWNLAAGRSGTALNLLPERFAFDLGIGAGFRVGNWKVQPELMYSYGLNNLHDFQNSPYDWAVGRVLRDRLSLRVVVGFPALKR